MNPTSHLCFITKTFEHILCVCSRGGGPITVRSNLNKFVHIHQGAEYLYIKGLSSCKKAQVMVSRALYGQMDMTEDITFHGW